MLAVAVYRHGEAPMDRDVPAAVSPYPHAAAVAAVDACCLVAEFAVDRPLLIVDSHSYLHAFACAPVCCEQDCAEPDRLEMPVGIMWHEVMPEKVGATAVALGCCAGASPRITEALRAALVRPCAVLASTAHCVRFEDGPALWPSVLARAAAIAAVGRDAHAAADLLREALAEASSRTPSLATHWTVRVLNPSWSGEA